MSPIERRTVQVIWRENDATKLVDAEWEDRDIDVIDGMVYNPSVELAVTDRHQLLVYIDPLDNPVAITERMHDGPSDDLPAEVWDSLPDGERLMEVVFTGTVKQAYTPDLDTWWETLDGAKVLVVDLFPLAPAEVLIPAKYLS